MSGNGDYISREAICLTGFEIAMCNGDYKELCKMILDKIAELPAADVVEVVRCKDCKYSKHWYRDKRLCRLWYGEEKPSAPIDVFDDGFCNYGERREDDD